jgi:hypothetical protein
MRSATPTTQTPTTLMTNSSTDSLLSLTPSTPSSLTVSTLLSVTAEGSDETDYRFTGQERTPETSPFEPPNTQLAHNNNDQCLDMPDDNSKLFAGDGKDEESPQDFLKQVTRHTLKQKDEDCLEYVEACLKSGSEAEKWFEELEGEKKATWAAFKAAWAEQYPPLKTVGKTMGEYEKELLAIKLTNEDMTKVVEKGGVEMTMTEWTALEMHRVAKLLGIEKTASFISVARRNLPDAIRQKVSSNHESWKEFTDAVREVDKEYLAEAAEKAEKERKRQREQDQMIARLNSMARTPNSPTKTIRSQFGGFSIAREPSPSPASPSRTPAVRGGGTSFAGGRTRKPETAALAVEMSDEAAKAIAEAMVEYLNTNEGRAAYLAATEEWFKKHGKGTPMKVTLANPFLLRPGSSPVGYGECFTCGLYNPANPHISINCPYKDTASAANYYEQRTRSLFKAKLGAYRRWTMSRTQNVNLVDNSEEIFNNFLPNEEEGNGEGLQQ